MKKKMFWSFFTRLARKMLVGLFISRNPRTAHRIMVLPSIPRSRVKLKKYYEFENSYNGTSCLE
jgi:hypothetical protein